VIQFGVAWHVSGWLLRTIDWYGTDYPTALCRFFFRFVLVGADAAAFVLPYPVFFFLCLSSLIGAFFDAFGRSALPAPLCELHAQLVKLTIG
jgi:hypothetical protein